MREGQFLV